MIDREHLADALVERGIGLFSGVPCSYLGGLIETVEARGLYVPAADEGAALAIAAGAQLGGRRAAVTIQNSGLGNLINPLTSLMLPCRIPALILVSLRGWPDPAQDEPQHAVMGTATTALLDAIAIDHHFVPPNAEDLTAVLDRADDAYRDDRCSVLLVPRGTIEPAVGPSTSDGARDRAAVLQMLVPYLQDAVVFASTGLISRELFSLADRPRNFYMQGSMGHASALAAGMAAVRPSERVIVVDGDGSLLMHLGTMSTIGSLAPANLLHVVVDNGMYDSTGGQRTTADAVSWTDVALGVGYRAAFHCGLDDELAAVAAEAFASDGPALLSIDVSRGAGAIPARVTSALTPAGNAQRLSDDLLQHV
jgi:phosphonopyruvate decarboxylase